MWQKQLFRGCACDNSPVDIRLAGSVWPIAGTPSLEPKADYA